jgi:hypothetical protein
MKQNWVGASVTIYVSDLTSLHFSDHKIKWRALCGFRHFSTLETMILIRRG